MRRRTQLLLVLLLLSSIGLWHYYGLESPPSREPVSPPGAQRSVDYQLTGLEAITMAADGSPARTLRAAEVRHFADDNTRELRQPHLTIHQGEQPPVEISAPIGWVSADGSHVELSEQVRIQRAAGPDNRPLLLTTPKLSIYPQRDYAETDEQVRVSSNRDWLEATGMQAWLSQPPRIKFLANVKSFYAAPATD